MAYRQSTDCGKRGSQSPLMPMHDAHCHVDQHAEPEAFVRQLETRKIHTVAVTNLPSHYSLSLPHLRHCRYAHPALGLHPLLAIKHARELAGFERLARSADFVGEIGLDFSKEGYQTKKLQLASFRRVLSSIQNRPRVVTVHSRGAEDEVLAELREFHLAPVILHWFTGSLRSCVSALEDGHWFSINISMLRSDRGRSLVARMPRERVLLESDYPHVRVNGRAVEPVDLSKTTEALCDLWKISSSEAEAQLDSNWCRLTQEHC